jgi:hypothetical protein
VLPSEPLCHGRPSGLTGSSGMLTLFGPGGEFSLDIQDVRVLRTSPRSLLSGRPRSCDPPPGLSQDPLLLPWLLRVPVNLGLDIRMPPMPAVPARQSRRRRPLPRHRWPQHYPRLRRHYVEQGAQYAGDLRSDSRRHQLDPLHEMLGN